MDPASATPQDTATTPTRPSGPVPVNPASQQGSTTQVVYPTINPVTQGSLSSLALANFIRPRARLQRIDHTVRPGEYKGDEESTYFAEFAQALYQYLSGLIAIQYGVSDLIEEADFVKVCQTLLVYRVQQVREHRVIARPVANRIVISRSISIPAALFEVLAGVGETYLEHKGFSYVPNLPSVKSPAPGYYTVDQAAFLKFVTFIDLMNRQGLHRSVPFPSQYEGTPYWVLSRQVDTSGFVSVTGSTGEGTPADGMLRAIIAIAGNIGGEREGFVYVQSIDPLTLRNSYFAMN